MVKNLVQDVVPPSRRSIRNVPVPSHKQKDVIPVRVTIPAKESVRPKRKTPDVVEEFKQRMEAEDSTQNPSSKKKYIILTLVFLFIGGFLYIFTAFFASADITITPRQEKVTLDETLFIGDKVRGIPYEMITLSKVHGIVVPATENETAEERAFGTIIVYNKHSSASQRLVKNTRFETVEGLVYRIRDSVNVPGTTVKDGQLIPGSVEAVVYADSPGEKYNIGLTDFTIPGFKGDPRYANFYARSKTPMEGGFVGVRKKVAEAQKKTAIIEIQKQLKDLLAPELLAQVPQNFITFTDLSFFSFEDAPQAEVTDSSVKINVKGTLRAAILEKDLLEEFIARETAPALSGLGDAEFIDISTLLVSVPQKDSNIIEKKGVIEVKIQGSGIVALSYSEDAIRGSLLGVSIDNFDLILEQYNPSIKEATASISPFWKRMFPEEADKLTITKVLIE